MAISAKRDEDSIREYLYEVAQSYGLTRTDRIVGAIVQVVSEVLASEFARIYSLEDQAKLQTATGEWLDNFALLAGVDRSATQTSVDLSLDNVYLMVSTGLRASDYTPGGIPLVFQPGVSIYSEDGKEILKTIDTVVMSDNRAFVRVAVVATDLPQINPGVYRTSAELPAGAENLAGGQASIQAVVQRPIPVSVRDLSDEELRSIVSRVASSRNLFNRESIYRIMSNSQVAKFVVKELNNGSSSVTLFIEPTIGGLSQSLKASIISQLSSIVPLGTALRIAPMVGSLMTAKIEIVVPSDTSSQTITDIVSEAKAKVATFLGSLGSGTPVVLDTLVEEIKSVRQEIQAVSFREVRINGETFNGTVYTPKDIEYLYTTAELVDVNVTLSDN